MRLRTRHLVTAIAATAAAALLVTGCSPASDGTAGGSDRTTVTFRLWDPQVAKAYQASFAAFEQTQDEIHVEIETIPWADYWTKLPQDVGSGDMADVFWTNSANFISYAGNGDLIDIDDRFGEQGSGWKQSVVDQYTWDGRLWGVPQLWDSIAVYYHTGLVEAAGVDPATLRWDPSEAADTLLPAARRLTIDSAGRTADQDGFDPAAIEQFGFNAALDLQSIVLDFVGSGGGQLQVDGVYALDSPQTQAAIQYVVDLINQHHVSPSAADTNTDGEKTRDLFIQGKLALYQSGPWRLKDIQEGADFPWGIAPVVAGPAGRVSAVNGIIAAGYAGTDHVDETLAVLRWLGSAEGQRPIAEGGYAFPGVTAAEEAYVRYWSDQGIDVQPFIDAANGPVIYPPIGQRAQAGMTAVLSVLEEVFLGRTPVPDGLAEAQRAGNDTMG